MAFSLFGGADKKDATAGTSSGDSTSANSIKENLQAQILQEIALTNATELISKISNNCYEKCILTPGSSLSAVDTACLDQCSEKYIQAWNIISRRYLARVQSESKS
ncbi:Tim10/DDP family zinc finger-domain-containing protein [Lipomyces tetrasporus]|uniref:Mitochondrial import inner membrane translocase subunit n=1 Tax=Lipomyces tetrasporus TaxID=54092 RepID=A0AAD7QYR9_9ASCO|nr:Tim10/DDP family zinc finger-domain-containing protein [Lipomyces tetrasporus]KAJ8103939.1 Tim10/DDP family zinc finger-domain-containing protein [Lipomyces tetrasporus]